MTILYLYQYFGTPKGGWSTRVYEMTKRWVKAGHRVIVITTPYDKSDLRARKFIERQFFDGVEVVVINLLQSNKHHFFKRATWAILFATIASYYAIRLRYDVVIASSGPITIGIPGLIGKWFRKKKLVMEVRDLWPQGAVDLGVIKNTLLIKVAFLFEKRLYNSSSLIVACSDGMKSNILMRFPDLDCITVPNSCDLELFSKKVEFSIPENLGEKKIVLYAGSLGLMDNCIQIVEAAKLLQEWEFEEAVIVVLGDGAERKMLEVQIESLKLRNIVFFGLVPKFEVIGWMHYAEVSLVVFKDAPMLNTSSPNKFFDSIAAGVPVIQTTQGWIKNLIDIHGGGISVSPNNPKEMASAIRDICSDRDLQMRLSKQASSIAKEFFDRDKLSDFMIQQISNAIRK